MRTPEGDQISAIISRHIGADQSITAPEICLELGWKPSRYRRVRQIIAAEAVLWPALVCAKSGDGYFVASNYEEAESYHNWLLELAVLGKMKLLGFRKMLSQHGLHVPISDAARELGVAA